MAEARKKQLTPKQKSKILAEWKTGEFSVHQLSTKWGRGFYTIKDIVESTPVGNDTHNSTKIALANRAIAKAQKPDATTLLLRKFLEELKNTAPNAQRVVVDVSRGEASVEVLSTLTLKVR